MSKLSSWLKKRVGLPEVKMSKKLPTVDAAIKNAIGAVLGVSPKTIDAIEKAAESVGKAAESVDKDMGKP
jgi:hypothetical protein